MPDNADITDTPGSVRPTDQDEIRARILRAAEERFVRYGFGKTTMAEIASDCGMSAGNLYRFFDNKGDIAVASASQWLAALEARLAGIAHDAELAPVDRLRGMVHAKLDAFAELVDAQPHLEELIEHVCGAREDLVTNHRAAIRELLADVIADGLRSGDFDIEDPSAAAEAFQVGTVGLFHHNIICTVPFEKLRADADMIIALMIRGLGKR